MWLRLTLFFSLISAATLLADMRPTADHDGTLPVKPHPVRTLEGCDDAGKSGSIEQIGETLPPDRIFKIRIKRDAQGEWTYSDDKNDPCTTVFTDPNYRKADGTPVISTVEIPSYATGDQLHTHFPNQIYLYAGPDMQGVEKWIPDSCGCQPEDVYATLVKRANGRLEAFRIDPPKRGDVGELASSFRKPLLHPLGAIFENSNHVSSDKLTDQ